MRAVPGYGLGLPIVKAVADWHDGRVWVESEPGQATASAVAAPPRSAGGSSVSSPGRSQPDFISAIRSARWKTSCEGRNSTPPSRDREVLPWAGDEGTHWSPWEEE